MPYTIACTGHRPPKLAGYSTNIVATYIYRWIASQLIKRMQEHDEINCISGMALGVDTIFASVVNVIKDKYPDRIRLIAALPYENHGSNWPIKSQQYHQTILDKADEEKLVCSGSYANWKLLKRDEWMVDEADELFAIWNGDESGGTFHTVQYARSNNKNINYINEKKLNTMISIAKRLDQLKESN